MALGYSHPVVPEKDGNPPRWRQTAKRHWVARFACLRGERRPRPRWNGACKARDRVFRASGCHDTMKAASHLPAQASAVSRFDAACGLKVSPSSNR